MNLAIFGIGVLTVYPEVFRVERPEQRDKQTPLNRVITRI